MRILWFTIGSAVTIAVLAGLPSGDARRWSRAWLVGDDRSEVRVDDFAPCDGARDATASVQRALERARGRTLMVPAGCRLLLRSPGAGRAAVTIGSETTVRFAGRTAAFVLAQRRCVGGRFEGAACRTDAECRGGACRCDGGDGPDCPFAPVQDRAYLVLAAEPASRGVVLDGVRIDVGGLDRFARCAGGTDAGLPCEADDDCRAGGTCTGVGTSPSGPGRVNAIDLTMVGAEDDPRVVGAELRGLQIFDHARGDFSVRTGPSARVTEIDNGLETEGARRAFRLPEIGIDAGSRNQVSASTVTANRLGVQLSSFSTLRDSTVTTMADGADNVAGTTVNVTGTQNRVESNQLTGFHCLAVAPIGAVNLTFANNRCLFGSGAKVVANGAGVNVLGNYLAWGSGRGGLCAAGPRAGRPCHAGYDCGTDATCDAGGTCRGGGRDGARCGCPLASCRPDPVIRIGSPGALGTTGVDHLMIANNLVHSQIETAFLGISDVGSRCLGGPAEGAPCELVNDCREAPEALAGSDALDEGATAPGECPEASCGIVTIRKSIVVGNNFYAPQTMTGLDLSALTSGATRVDGLSLLDNRFSAPGPCVALPANEENASGLALVGNDFADCTLDERLAARAAEANRQGTVAPRQ